ncbi:DUF1800 domain-containing protein [Aestuariicoccus sp. MJ-SS9]|uniref:DUF1800 domain-containing protein n=1 Tax=Aestuariicoccus sp. MJ-SS9 TaxID=3079855 RepID=UPI0029148C9D|nr:DUF1800 domain-containing protein [Aestuariicoccus sp. MJ-SS9]MDU8910077.1 DUF1800 domain-containing protein [Aestuariicoccus sp. MJ-SS9]
MKFDPVLADIRFGCGLSPRVGPPGASQAILDSLDAPDRVARTFPIEPFETFLIRMQERQRLSKIRRAQRGTPEAEAARKAIKVLNKTARIDQATWMGQHILRRTWTDAPFRERLTFFWGDHFTAAGKAGLIRRATSPYFESAIRPNIAGRFEDLLIAAVTHPLMVHYLDQDSSIGPSSEMAAKRGKAAGLNENLAREVLELHTLGADGPYTQADVRQLAELLTGLTLNFQTGTHFRKPFAEPGAETVLGKSYGGDNPNLGDIRAVLRDLARHPSTARHLARKLAVHFVSDSPDPDLVAALERSYRDTGGDLKALYATLLDHPGAWRPEGGNVKQPFDFIASACRALALPRTAFDGMKENRFRTLVIRPLGLMGHIWEKPDGPDGLDEADTAWVTPQGLAARLQWAVTVPQLLLPDLPDPRDFAQTALGPRASPPVRFAAEAAESRWEGIGLILASPAFQRM